LEKVDQLDFPLNGRYEGEIDKELNAERAKASEKIKFLERQITLLE
jgi:hypothetical protein